MKNTSLHAASALHRPNVPQQLSKFVAASLISLLALAVPALRANDPKLSFKIPPVNIPLHIKGQELNIVASGAISMARKDHDLNEMNLSLNADLADLQKILARCWERCSTKIRAARTASRFRMRRCGRRRRTLPSPWCTCITNAGPA